MSYPSPNQTMENQNNNNKPETPQKVTAFNKDQVEDTKISE